MATGNYLFEVFRKWLSRDDWGAEPPQGPVEKAEGLVSRVYFHYRTGTPRCFNIPDCCATVRKIQENHFKRRMGDIAFNGGNIFEGRGFGVLPPPELKKSGPPGDRMDIAFIGDWTVESLPCIIFKGGLAVMERGIEKGYLSPQWKFHAVILEKKPSREDVIKKKTKHREVDIHPVIQESEEEFNLENTLHLL